MALIVVVWGVHFIVVKDAISDLPPLTFNAIRFVMGLPLLLFLGLRNPAAMRIDRRDIPRLIGLGLLGPFGYQIGFILGLQHTTSTNTALLTATMPTWTALLTLVLGVIMIRRQLILGVVISLVGVVLVVMSRSGASLALSAEDLLGSSLALGAAIVTAIYNLSIKPLIDRYGGTVIAVWTYCLTTVALIVCASPDLITVTPADLPLSIWPHIIYSGVISCALGFLVENYAIRHIGPARTSLYYNFTPLIAAAAAVLVLGEPLNAGLVIGAGLTLWGVVIVRHNTYLRLPKTEPLPDIQPEKKRTREMVAVAE
jgi:drug/metabolite transporter (DMT)-like permease